MPRTRGVVLTILSILALVLPAAMALPAPSVEAARPPVHHTAPPAAPSASAALALNPVSTEAGDSVQVAGSGFAALTTVSLSLPVYVNGVLQDVGTAVATDAQGAFTINLLLPAGTEPGSYRVSASDAQHDAAWAHLVVLPAVTVIYGSSQIASTFVAPGQEFTVRGVGYPAGSSVQITATFSLNGGGSAELTQTARADATGRFELYLRVPASAAQGQVQLQAQTGTTTVSADLNVVPLGVLAAGTSAPPLQVSAGGAFYVEGLGFGAGENVQLTAAFPLFNGSSVTVSKEISADAQGAFNATLLAVPPGVKQAVVSVTAVGLTSGRQATLTAAVAYHPSITLSAAKVQPGASITITGSGFAPGAQVALTLSNANGTQITTITSTAGGDANGDFTAAMVVPSNLTPGTYTLSAKGSLTGASASSTVTVAPAAAISVQPATALPGQKVTVTGQGFTAYTAVQVKMTVSVYGGGSQTVSQTVGAGAAGRFTAQLTLPGKAAAGAATVTATGPNAQASTQIQVGAITPAISITAGTVLPGQTIAVTGSGFPAYDAAKVSIAVRLSDGSTRTLSATAHAGAKGAFLARITVPSDVVPGTYTITALSTLSGREATTQLTVSIHPQLSVQPTSVQPGASVTVSGSGFGGGALITVRAAFPLYGGGSKTVSTSVRSTGTGSITAPLLVPSQAAAGSVSVTATGPNGHATSNFQVGNLTANVTVTPSLIIPGASVTIAGSGYLPNGKVDIALVVAGLNGTQRTLTATATTNGAGQFSTTLEIPVDVSSGTYTVTARGELSGRAPTAKVVVGKPAPALAGTPGTVAPGARVSVSGSGFAANATVKISFQAQTLATATTSGTGSFSTTVTVPANTASGTYALTATSSAGRSARFSLAVNRPMSTHLYFASIYTGTGYQQQIDILNPTEIQSRVTITYLRTNGSTLVRTVTVPAHTRATENANTDLGVHVSASAVVAADVPVIAERVSLHGSDATVVPAVVAPATSWYFADGNTSGKYREYIAIENPNNQPARVTVHLLPTHHRPLDVTRMVGANARTTVKVNSYVRDAVGAIVTSGSPVVANRTVFIHHGTSSKIGVTAPAIRWYFAAGPSNGGAHHWIGVINPNPGRAYVSLRAYAPDGAQVAAVQGWIKGFGRAGYLMNRIAKRTDVAVVVTASRAIVAEQMTYAGRLHNASTDAFGVTAPGTGWGFAAADTTGGKTDSLALFNPNSESITVTARFMTSSGQVTQQTYTVGPLAHREIAVDSQVPNAQLGVVASSPQPFVALNRQTLSGGQGALVSAGSAVQA